MEKRKYLYPTTELPLTVNYNLAVEGLLAQARVVYYSDKNWNSKNFPPTMAGIVNQTAVIIYITKTHKDEIKGILDRMGLRPANIHELLHYAIEYGQKHPEILELSAWGSTCGPLKGLGYNHPEFGPRLYRELGQDGEDTAFGLCGCDIPQIIDKNGETLPYGHYISGLYLMIKK